MGFETNDDGSLRFIDKKKKPEKELTVESTIKQNIYSYFNLYSCNIESNVVGESIKIFTKDLLVHVELDRISDFELSIDTIRLSTTDEVAYYLTFVSNDEAIKGFDKIEAAISGDAISCTDSPVTKIITIEDFDPSHPAAAVLFPAIFFIDNNPPIHAFSLGDLISQLNLLGTDKFTVSNIGLPQLQFSFQPFKYEYIPKSIKFISRHLKLRVTSDYIYFKMDLYGGDIFYFVNYTELKLIESEYHFNDSSTKIVYVYFTKDNCNSLDIENTNSIIFQNTVSVLPGSMPNAPAFRRITSKDTNLTNFISLLSSSSISLEELAISNNGINLTLDLAAFSIKRLFLENCPITTLIIDKTAIQGLKIDNLSITSLSGPFPNLISCKVLNCGLLNSIDLTDAQLRDLQITNSAISSLTLNDSFDRLYELEISGTLLTSLPALTNSLKRINKFNLMDNDLLDLADYNSFLSSFILWNISQGGTFNLHNSSVEFSETEEEMIYQLRRRGWYVIY